MKKTYILLFFLFVVLGAYSQVGINTDRPNASLDINGSIELRSELRVGDNSLDEVAAGKPGQALTSQGPGLPPIWKDMDFSGSNIGDYLLANTFFSKDESGVIIDKDPTSTVSITPLEPLTDDWYVVDNLNTEFSITRTNSVALITFQNSVQSAYNITGNQSSGVDQDNNKGKNNWLDFAGGIFLKKGDSEPFLITARQERIVSARYPQVIFNLFYALEDLEIGDYQLFIAFKRLGSSSLLKSYPLYIGNGEGIPVSSSFMNRSYLRINLYEPKQL